MPLALALCTDRATCQVVPATESTCTLVWSQSFQSPDVDKAEELMKGFLPMMAAAAAWLGEKAGAPASAVLVALDL